jgi:MFS family permease
MAVAGPLTTISISLSSFFGVLIGGTMADKWYQSNPKGRMYTSAMGLALTIPSLILLGFGSSFLHIITAAVIFGLGFGMFDTNNMPILCQFVDKNQRATGYGFLNMGEYLQVPSSLISWVNQPMQAIWAGILHISPL